MSQIFVLSILFFLFITYKFIKVLKKREINKKNKMIAWSLYGITFVMLIGVNLIGWTNDKLSGDKPPTVMIEVNDEMYESTLGSYCWTGWTESRCVDTAGPIELLEGKEPIKVQPGESLSFVMDYEPKPTEIQVGQFKNNQETMVAMKNNQITTPMEKGIYYYVYSVRWEDENEPNVSRGDAYYAFAIEVE